MVVSQIISMITFETPVPITTLSSLVLSTKAEEQNNTACRAHPQHRQTYTVSRRIVWRFSGDEDIASRDTTEVTESDDHS